jgi:ribosomal protein S12 methylthiotransferase accessory factor
LPFVAEPPSGGAIDWSIWDLSGTTLKYGRQGATRTVPPSATVRRVAALMGPIGVSRVADVTHLDQTGVPNFIAARPRDGANNGISYYNGKGASRAQAKASAMMEAIERYSGEFCDQRPIVGTYESVSRLAAAVDPDQLLVPRNPEIDAHEPIEWVLGYDLLRKRPTYAPLNAVVTPYLPKNGRVLFWSSTNGLASGNTVHEALSQALCEVNERDAVSIFEARTRLKTRLGSLFARFEIADTPGPDGREYPLIDPATLPLASRRLIQRLRTAGLSVYLRDVTSPTRIATISCIISENLGRGRHRAHAGFGCHPDRRVAVIRAITEAVSSRLACIQGGREDLPSVVGERESALEPDRDFGAGELRPFADVPTVEISSVEEEVAWILSAFESAGFSQVVGFDLTRPELGVPVVRVVVPLAEAWSVFHQHIASGVIGRRALTMIH